MAYGYGRRRSTSRYSTRRSTRRASARPRRRASRRRTPRVQTVRIQIVGGPAGVVANPATLGQKTLRPMRARF